MGDKAVSGPHGVEAEPLGMSRALQGTPSAPRLHTSLGRKMFTGEGEESEKAVL